LLLAVVAGKVRRGTNEDRRQQQQQHSLEAKGNKFCHSPQSAGVSILLLVIVVVVVAAHHDE
jgi:hypothetical protein